MLFSEYVSSHPLHARVISKQPVRPKENAHSHTWRLKSLLRSSFRALVCQGFRVKLTGLGVGLMYRYEGCVSKSELMFLRDIPSGLCKCRHLGLWRPYPQTCPKPQTLIPKP